MPRQCKHHRREVHVFPEDFPQRLERRKEGSGLTWSELARRLGTNPLTLRALAPTPSTCSRFWSWLCR